jgi:Salmonella virulence plasmid 65kDa B protein
MVAMPLVSVPGRAGVEPTLALTYDSADGDGVREMGFPIGMQQRQGLQAVYALSIQRG